MVNIILSKWRSMPCSKTERQYFQGIDQEAILKIILKIPQKKNEFKQFTRRYLKFVQIIYITVVLANEQLYRSTIYT